jgi:hypothetical protein
MTTDTQEVVFSASVALPLQRTNRTLISSGHWLADASRVAAASMRRMFLTPIGVARPARRSYSARFGYLERSLMAREAERL